MQVLGIIGYDIADVPSAGRHLPELWRGSPASNPAMSGVAERLPGRERALLSPLALSFLTFLASLGLLYHGPVVGSVGGWT